MRIATGFVWEGIEDSKRSRAHLQREPCGRGRLLFDQLKPAQQKRNCLTSFSLPGFASNRTHNAVLTTQDQKKRRRDIGNGK